MSFPSFRRRLNFSDFWTGVQIQIPVQHKLSHTHLFGKITLGSFSEIQFCKTYPCWHSAYLTSNFFDLASFVNCHRYITFVVSLGVYRIARDNFYVDFYDQKWSDLSCNHCLFVFNHYRNVSICLREKGGNLVQNPQIAYFHLNGFLRSLTRRTTSCGRRRSA